jgi:hypothetical protein
VCLGARMLVQVFFSVSFAYSTLTRLFSLCNAHAKHTHASGYVNTMITVGDSILKIDDKDAQYVDLQTLHSMLRQNLSVFFSE